MKLKKILITGTVAFIILTPGHALSQNNNMKITLEIKINNINKNKEVEKLYPVNSGNKKTKFVKNLVNNKTTKKISNFFERVFVPGH